MEAVSSGVEEVGNYVRAPDHAVKVWCTICGKGTWFTDYQECKEHVREEHFSSDENYRQQNLSRWSS